MDGGREGKRREEEEGEKGLEGEEGEGNEGEKRGKLGYHQLRSRRDVMCIRAHPMTIYGNEKTS